MYKLKICPKYWSFVLFIGFAAVAMPLLAPLRVLGLGEPAEIRNIVYPVLLLLITLAYNPFKVFKARGWLQIILAVAFVQAMLVGIFTGQIFEQTRNFLSHLFQLSSAYLMVGVGWLSVSLFGKIFWRNWAFISFLAVTVATLITLTALGRGDVGRLYTPAYGLILILAYATVFSTSGVIATFLLALVSNKRGVILSLAMQVIYQWLNKNFKVGGVKYFLESIFRASIFSVIVALLILMIVNWASSQPHTNGIALAINITTDRLIMMIESISQMNIEHNISAGRDIEIAAALEQSKWWQWIIGGGAGWLVDIGHRDVHNIHLSPLSIALVFGAPFSLLLYGTLGWMLLKELKNSMNRQDATSLIAPVYLSGALVHSLFAYSLFVDLLVFFFAGVMVRNQASSSEKHSYKRFSI